MNLPFKVGISPTLKIRGLIATEDIRKGVVIEKCPIILINTKHEKILEKMELSTYYFLYTEKYFTIAFGYISILNHSFTPNCIYYRDFKNKKIIVKTIRNIKKGEELTIKYGNRNHIKKYPEYNIKL